MALILLRLAEITLIDAIASQQVVTELVTFNLRHSQPGHPATIALRPGNFILRVRDRSARLG